MKISQTKQKVSKKSIIISSISIVLFVCVLTIWYISQANSNTDNLPSETSAPEQVTSNNKDGVKSNPTTNENILNEDIPVSENGSVMITNITQDNGIITVLVGVSNFTVAQCVYSFTSEGSKPVVKETSDGCEQISISQDEFDKIGNYTLTVSAYGSNQKIIATKDVYIQ